MERGDPLGYGRRDERPAESVSRGGEFAEPPGRRVMAPHNGGAGRAEAEALRRELSRLEGDLAAGAMSTAKQLAVRAWRVVSCA